MLWSPSTSRILFTLVPTLMTEEVPLTFKSLMTVTESNFHRVGCSRLHL